MQDFFSGRKLHIHQKPIIKARLASRLRLKLALIYQQEANDTDKVLNIGSYKPIIS